MTSRIADQLRRFPDFRALPPDAASELEHRARAAPVAAGKLLARQGDPCSFFPIVLSGSARIFSSDEDGREITLYRLAPGDGCVLAAFCALGGEALPGNAMADEAGAGLFIPASSLRAWVERHAFWRDYVYGLVARQLARVVASAHELAFRQVDARIARFLVEEAHANAGARVIATHQSVALEVGTRREVASLILKSFERAGWIALGRGVIRLHDRAALTRCAFPVGAIASAVAARANVPRAAL